MIWLLLAMTAVYVMDRYHIFDKFRKDDTAYRYVRWNFKEYYLDVPVFVYSLRFMSNSFHVSYTMKPDSNGLYFVSFRKNCPSKNIISDDKYKEFSIPFRTLDEAETYANEFKSRLSQDINENNESFKVFSKRNRVMLMEV